MTFHYRYRKQIIIGSLVCIFLLGIISFGIFRYFKSDKNKEVKKEEVLISKKDEKEENKNKDKEKEEKIINTVKVDIKGEVINPGLYTIDASSRVMDVINMAGGLTENADVTVINLSKKVIDEMVIIIYSRQEVEDFSKTKEIEEKIIESCNRKDDVSLKNDACIESDEESVVNTKININTATKEELMMLTGIGESKAIDIITYREANGGFKTIEDLKNVSGIGDSVFDKIKENITV